MTASRSFPRRIDALEQLFGRIDVRAFELVARDDRDRDRHVLQILFALLRGDDDVGGR